VIPWCGFAHILTTKTVAWYFLVTSFVVLLGSVLTYAIGLPNALNMDKPSGSACTTACSSFIGSDDNGNKWGPAVGWILAVATDGLLLILIVIFVFHKNSPINVSERA